MSRPLGKEQRAFLQTLVEHRYWYAGGYGCGWTWNGVSTTLRLCVSLAKRGLVEPVERPGGIRPDTTVTAYVASAAGQQLVAEWKAERLAARAAAEKGGAK